MDFHRSVQLKNKYGLHARTSGMIHSVACRFQASVRIVLEAFGDGTRPRAHESEADAKSVLSLLTLGASRGSVLRIVATGPDAREAVDAVAALVEREFDGVDREPSGGGRSAIRDA
jgi:phosphotransferase system HPr (HPr) family protein